MSVHTYLVRYALYQDVSITGVESIIQMRQSDGQRAGHPNIGKAELLATQHTAGQVRAAEVRGLPVTSEGYAQSIPTEYTGDKHQCW